MKSVFKDDWDEVESDKLQPAPNMKQFAIEAMEELEKNGVADLLLLRNDRLRAWWKDHKEAEARKLAAELEKERRARVREEALAKLSSEEREILGLAPKTSTVKRVRHKDTGVYIRDWESTDFPIEHEDEYGWDK